MSDPTIPAEMKPWAGGDTAPADWDGGPVLFRTGRVAMPVMRQGVWEHPCPYPAASDIIAYTPALSTPTTPGEGLSASDKRDLAEMVTAWRSSLVNPVTWMEKLRGLLAASTEVQGADVTLNENGVSLNVEAMRAAAQFLSDRLDDLEWMDDDLAATCRDYFGHVEPAHERLKALLAKGER